MTWSLSPSRPPAIGRGGMVSTSQPLAALTVKQRDRLEATLLAWLETNRGSAPQVAARLGIHPQTARSRLHRVQELFGPALAEPKSRFEIEVALRGRLLIGRGCEPEG